MALADLPINRPTNQPTTAQSLPSRPALHLAHRSTKLNDRLSSVSLGSARQAFRYRTLDLRPLSILGLTFGLACIREDHARICLCFSVWGSTSFSTAKTPLYALRGSDPTNSRRNKPTIITDAVLTTLSIARLFSIEYFH